MFKPFDQFLKAELSEVLIPIEQFQAHAEKQLKMLRKPAINLAQIASLAGLVALSACSRAVEDFPVAPLINTLPSESRGAAATFREALPDILLGIEDVRSELTRLRVERGGAGFASSPAAPPVASDLPVGTDSSLGADLAAPPTVPVPGDTSSPAAPATSTAPALPDGQAEFEKILNKIGTSPFATAHIEKSELGLENRKLGKVELKMHMKRPNTVKLEIIKSTAGDSAGAKIIYTSGQGDKAKVRPGGGLSFITTDLEKSDDRLDSNNGFIFDDIDLIGVHKRMVQGYSAELVGKTSLNGVAIHVLKVTPKSGANELNAKITHEMIGYEPDNYTLRLWEMYADGEKQPFFRMNIKEISFPSTLPDSTFKL